MSVPTDLVPEDDHLLGDPDTPDEYRTKRTVNPDNWGETQAAAGTFAGADIEAIFARDADDPQEVTVVVRKRPDEPDNAREVVHALLTADNAAWRLVAVVCADRWGVDTDAVNAKEVRL